jgi:signal transduction histidine kinase
LKLRKDSLKVKVWLYLIIFSVTILAFLWVFQVIFLDSYYEWVKTKELGHIVDKILETKNVQNYEELFEDIAYEKGVCVDVVKNNYIIYSSNNFNRGCILETRSPQLSITYKIEFINSGLTKKSYMVINPRFDNKTLIYGMKLDDNTYGFVNASLEPLDSTIMILKNQLIYVTIIVLLLSFIIAYFISRKIANPIIKINESAKKMANGQYDVVFKTNENIAEINELADTLNYARDELDKTDELRRELLANVSHDLKTPLTMIKAYAEMVRDLTHNNKEKRNNNLNIIIEESDRLNCLVNDILDLSSMQSKISTLKYEDFDIVDLINKILKRYTILKEKEGYEFIFQHKESVIVTADKKKIEQVIYNLINNAINYTGKDKKVEIKVISKDDSYLVEIIDTGKGIDEKNINFIWDKYYKVDKNHKRSTIGTGLGLAIVKNILQLHNFKFGVKSKKRKGTTFHFEIKKGL